MLLMCGESWFKKSFDGPAKSYRQMLGFKGWKDRGRLFVTSVHERGAIAGNSALKTAEKWALRPKQTVSFSPGMAEKLTVCVAQV